MKNRGYYSFISDFLKPGWLSYHSRWIRKVIEQTNAENAEKIKKHNATNTDSSQNQKKTYGFRVYKF
jgi:hypothetical protein